MASEDYQERLKTTGRNDPCPCGSQQKYKKCHQAKDEAELHAERQRQAKEDEAAHAAASEAEADEARAGKASLDPTRGDRRRHHAHSPGEGGQAARPKNLPRRGAI
jgi:hypothetical protein